jgi:NADH:ubiquinone oxidoreductase subunit 2 (subunit N)
MIVDDAIEDSMETTTVSMDRLAPYKTPRSYQITIAASVFLVIIVGILPAPFIDFALNAAAILFG